MEDTTPTRNILMSFPRSYWVVIVMEFFERFAFYGMMAMLADYFVQNVGSTEDYGLMRTVLFVILYLVPILSGALAEKVGYKNILGVSFILMTGAYIAVGTFTNFWIFFAFMILLGTGGGLFKPIISGTIARSTDKSNSTVGFGIYYWSINVGSFIASLVTAYFVKIENVYPVFILSAIFVGLMFFNNLFFYREPAKPGKIKSYRDTWNGILTVSKNWRFILLLFIFSGFWGMYDRSTDSALWLLRENYIDMTPVNQFVTGLFSALGIEYQFEFTVANIMTINAGVIILFQVFVSYLVRNTKPVPTMIVGIGMASLFPILVALSNNPWVFVFGLVIFSIGEITAYPKLISYIGIIAPKDKVAIYMGFVFLPIFFSALLYSYPNGVLWERLVIQRGEIKTYWWIVAGLGIATMLGLLFFHLFVGKKLVFSDQKGEAGEDS